MKEQTIIIIGGGISGLVAARSLSRKYNVVLLEALRRFGGRIHTIKKEGTNQHLEGGAEFIHGSALETIKLLKLTGLKYTKVVGKFYRKKKKLLVVDEELMEGWENLLLQMGKLEEDMTLNHFLDTFFGDESYQNLRLQAREYAEGFDIADPDKVSTKSLYNEWSKQSTDHRVDSGYSALINFLVKDIRQRGGKLITEAIVKNIDWQDQQVVVKTIDHQTHTADKCIITVPIGILQNPKGLTIQFQPAIPEYLAAFGKIGYGKVIKVVLTFRSRFWKKDAGFFLCHDAFSAWWTQLPAASAILTGWAGGLKAEDLSIFSAEVLIEKAIASLSALFTMDEMTIKDLLLDWEVFNWQNERSILGGYSYATPETAAALQILHTPIKETLFFAGEGLYSGDHPGTVEAAIVSAKQTVVYLLKR
jgi:monoamine oxidase